jgi:cytochrome c biogenesis protein CcdA
MLFLILFAFIAGVVTILSPCILPILPVVLSGAIDKSKKRPFGIIVGFIASFTFFTLFLSAIVTTLSIPADSLRTISVVIIFLFGLSLLVPQIQIFTERLFSKLSQNAPQKQRSGFFGGILIGLSLGLVWTPCVGPILASVITLAATNSVNFASVWITLAYAIGTAIPMLLIMQLGRSLFLKVPWLLSNTGTIQKIFGVLMIAVAIALFFNAHKQFQTYILNTFPDYSSALTQFEENNRIDQELDELMR